MRRCVGCGTLGQAAESPTAVLLCRSEAFDEVVRALRTFSASFHSFFFFFFTQYLRACGHMGHTGGSGRVRQAWVLCQLSEKASTCARACVRVCVWLFFESHCLQLCCITVPRQITVSAKRRRTLHW